MSIIDEALKLTPVIAVLLAYVLFNRHQIKQDKLKIKEIIVDFFDDTTEAMGELMDEFVNPKPSENKKKFSELVTKYNKARMRFLSRITIYAESETEITAANDVMDEFNEILDKIDEKTYFEKIDKEQTFTAEEFNILFDKFTKLKSHYSSYLRYLKIEYNV